MNYGQGQASSNAISQNYNAQTAAIGGMQAAAPRTVASALSRMDALNERLAEVRNHLTNIADMIGGPRPANGQVGKDRAPSAGVVDRLNDAADAGHVQAGEIADLLSAIHRALG